jgi:hypothetical protein
MFVAIERERESIKENNSLFIIISNSLSLIVKLLHFMNKIIFLDNNGDDEK